MKKFFLTSLGLLVAALGFAQTTIDTANPVTEGDNTFSNEQATANTDAYWKYTSTEDEILIAIPLNNSAITGYEWDGEDDPVRTSGSSYTKYENNEYVMGTAFAVPAGKTVYICANAFQTMGFKAIIKKSPNVMKGTSENDWGEIVPGTMQLFGNDNNGRYNPICATYTPDKDGVLKIVTSGSVSYVADESGVQYSFDRNSQTYEYTASVPVVGGKENKLRISSYGSLLFTSEMTYPQPGSFDKPFSIVSGANAVPKAAGTYWYVVAGRDGMMNIMSGDTFDGGALYVYGSTYAINNDTPDAQSNNGSYNVSLAAKSNNSYYIKVVKDETAADQSFDFEIADFQPGDTEDEAIVITDYTKTYTVPAGKTVYYAVNVPKGVKKNLSVKATSGVKNASTQVSVYQYSYSSVSGNSSVLTTVSGGTYGDALYKIKWVSKEDGELSFSVALDDLAQGDDISNPLDAKLGENTVAGDGTKYYSFLATESGKLDVTVPDGMTAKFPKTTGYGYLDAIQNGNTYSIDAVKDASYSIELGNCVKGAKFTLAYGEWAAGEAATNPIVVENGVYELGSGVVSNLWLKYTVKKNCKLTIFVDGVPYSYSDKAEYCPEGNTANLVGLYDYDSKTQATFFRTTFGAGEGESYLLHIALTSAYEGAKVTFTEVEPAAGETVYNPVVLDGAEPVDIPKADYYTPVWVKMSLKAGKVYLVSEKQLSATLYMSKDDALAGNQYGTVYFTKIESDDDVAPAGQYKYTLDVAADGDLYLKVTYAEADCTLKAVCDSATGINGASASEAQPVGFYTLDGTKLSAPQKGINIVKMSDGRTVKVVVRK